MANLANLAPPITRETAPDMARRAVKSRLARIARENEAKRQIEIEARALALSRDFTPDQDEARKKRVALEIDRVLDRLNKNVTDDVRIKLHGSLARLWDLIQPKAAPYKQSRLNRRLGAPAVIQETPQEPVA